MSTTIIGDIKISRNYGTTTLKGLKIMPHMTKERECNVLTALMEVFTDTDTYLEKLFSKDFIDSAIQDIKDDIYPDVAAHMQFTSKHFEAVEKKVAKLEAENGALKTINAGLTRTVKYLGEQSNIQYLRIADQGKKIDELEQQVAKYQSVFELFEAFCAEARKGRRGVPEADLS